MYYKCIHYLLFWLEFHGVKIELAILHKKESTFKIRYIQYKLSTYLQTLWRFGSGLDSDNLSSNRDQPDQEIEVARHWEEQSKDDSKQPSPFHFKVELQKSSLQPHIVTDAVPSPKLCICHYKVQRVHSEHLNRLWTGQVDIDTKFISEARE